MCLFTMDCGVKRNSVGKLAIDGLLSSNSLRDKSHLGLSITFDLLGATVYFGGRPRFLPLPLDDIFQFYDLKLRQIGLYDSKERVSTFESDGTIRSSL